MPGMNLAIVAYEAAGLAGPIQQRSIFEQWAVMVRFGHVVLACFRPTVAASCRHDQWRASFRRLTVIPATSAPGCLMVHFGSNTITAGCRRRFPTPDRRLAECASPLASAARTSKPDSSTTSTLSQRQFVPPRTRSADQVDDRRRPFSGKGGGGYAGRAGCQKHLQLTGAGGLQNRMQVDVPALLVCDADAVRLRRSQHASRTKPRRLCLPVDSPVSACALLAMPRADNLRPRAVATQRLAATALPASDFSRLSQGGSMLRRPSVSSIGPRRGGCPLGATDLACHLRSARGQRRRRRATTEGRRIIASKNSKVALLTQAQRPPTTSRSVPRYGLKTELIGQPFQKFTVATGAERENNRLAFHTKTEPASSCNSTRTIRCWRRRPVDRGPRPSSVTRSPHRKKSTSPARS